MAEKPGEIASQVSELQYLGKMTGIYDPFTEDFNEGHLRQLENLARQGKMPQTLLRTLMNLESLYEEDKLIKLMNTISQNDSEPQQNTMNYAKKGGTIKYQQGAQVGATPVMPEGKTVVALVNGEQKPIGVVESSSGNNITMRDFSGNIVSLTPTVGNKYTSTDAFFNQSLLGPSSAVSNDFPIMIAQNGGAFTLQKFSTGGTSKSSFPELSGDGKITQKDILMGRGVIKQQNAMNSYPAYQMHLICKSAIIRWPNAKSAIICCSDATRIIGLSSKW